MGVKPVHVIFAKCWLSFSLFADWHRPRPLNTIHRIRSILVINNKYYHTYTIYISPFRSSDGVVFRIISVVSKHLVFSHPHPPNLKKKNPKNPYICRAISDCFALFFLAPPIPPFTHHSPVAPHLSSASFPRLSLVSSRRNLLSSSTSTINLMCGSWFFHLSSDSFFSTSRPCRSCCPSGKRW